MATESTAFLDKYPSLKTGLDNIRQAKQEVARVIEKNPAAQASLGGLALGFGTKSIISLIKEVRDLIRDREKAKKRENPGISNDTVVITVPSRKKEVRASARDSIIDCVKRDEKNSKKNKDKENECGWKQARNTDGTFAHGWELSYEKDSKPSIKFAEGEETPPPEKYRPGFWEGAGDNALSIAGGTVATGIGWILAGKLHSYLKKKRLQREIAAAQKEYIDFLKLGSADPIVQSTEPTMAPARKDSWSSKFGDKMVKLVGGADSDMGATRAMAQGTMGLVGGLGLLIAFASTLLTKKYLDKKYNDLYANTTVGDPNRVNNIIVKTSSAEDVVMSPVDALAFVKMAAISMKADEQYYEALGFNEELKKIAEQLDDADTTVPDQPTPTIAPARADGGQGDFLSNLSKRVNELKQDGIALITGDEDGIAASTERNPDLSIGTFFNTIGETGEDGTWKLKDTNDAIPKSPADLARIRGVYRGMTGAKKDDFLRAFMSDKYKAHREALASKALEDWYGKHVEQSPVLSTFKKPIRWILNWLKNFSANTQFGQRLMWGRILDNMKKRSNTQEKAAGLGLLDLSNLSTSMTVGTDVRNKELAAKLDALAAKLENKDPTAKNHSKKRTIRITAADPEAKEAIKDNKKLIEQILREMG